VRVSQLFPLTSGYQAWGGACATARTVTTPSIMTGPGQESTGAVPSLGGVAVSVQGSTVAANSYTVVAKNVDCPAETYPLQGTLGLSGSSVLQIALPAGNWNLQATAGSTRTGSRLVTVTSGQVANGGAAVAVTVP